MLQEGSVAHILKNLTWKAKGTWLHACSSIQMSGPNQLRVPSDGWFEAHGPIADGYVSLSYIIHVPVGKIELKGLILAPMQSTGPYHHCLWLAHSPSPPDKTNKHPTIALGILSFGNGRDGPRWTRTGLGRNHLPGTPRSFPSDPPKYLPESINVLVERHERAQLRQRAEKAGQPEPPSFYRVEQLKRLTGRGWYKLMSFPELGEFLDTRESPCLEIHDARIEGRPKVVGARGAMPESDGLESAGSFTAEGSRAGPVGLLRFSMAGGLSCTGVMILPADKTDHCHGAFLTLPRDGSALPSFGRISFSEGEFATPPPWVIAEELRTGSPPTESTEAPENADALRVTSTAIGWGYDLRVPGCGEYLSQRGCVALLLTDLEWQETSNGLHLLGSVQMKGPRDLEVPPGGRLIASGPIRDGYGLLTYTVHLVTGASISGSLLVPMEPTDSYHHCFWLCQAPAEPAQKLLNHPILMLGILTLSQDTKPPEWTTDGLGESLPLPPPNWLAGGFGRALPPSSVCPISFPEFRMAAGLPEGIEALVAKKDCASYNRQGPLAGTRSPSWAELTGVLRQGTGWLEFTPLPGMRGYLDTTGSARFEMRNVRVAGSSAAVTTEGAVHHRQAGTPGTFTATGRRDRDVGLLVFSMTGNLLEATGIMVLGVQQGAEEYHGFFLALPGLERRLPSFGRVVLAEGKLPSPSGRQRQTEKHASPPAQEPARAKRVPCQKAMSTKTRKEFAEITKTVIARSKAMEGTLEFVRKASAPRNCATVLLRGETGTGKQVIAEAIHRLGSRHEKPFVQINCGALPPQLLESVLFGHEKGAFTGATRSSSGRVVGADGGTLFLDEIGDLPLELQVKVLRLIEQKKFVRVGGEKVLDVDARIIAATNRPLDEMVAQKAFRADLYFRLNLLCCSIPPLRDRRMDIPELARHVLDKLRCSGRGERLIEPEALAVLQPYHWPGNVRQLENVVERAFWEVDGTTITPGDIRMSLDHEPDMHESSQSGPEEKGLLVDRTIADLQRTTNLTEATLAQVREFAKALQTLKRRDKQRVIIAGKMIGVGKSTAYKLRDHLGGDHTRFCSDQT